MSDRFMDGPRLRDRTDQLDVAEREIGEALRALRPPAPLTSQQLARLEANLRVEADRRMPRPRHARAWIAAAAAFVLGIATAASAARLHLLPAWMIGASPAPSPQAVSPKLGSTSAKPRVRLASGTSAAEPPLPLLGPPNDPDAPGPAATVAPAPSVPPAPARPAPARVPNPEPPLAALPGRHAPTTASPPLTPPSHTTVPLEAPITVPVADPPSAVGRHGAAALPATSSGQRPMASGAAPSAEPASSAKYLADALRLIRADGAAATALALLDRHADEFAQGPYQHEALLVRVEALQALRRDDELLRLLDRSNLANVAASRMLLGTRGHLRAAAHRCADAIADFDRVLAEAGPTDRRVLQERAACRGQLGDVAGARADRERYRRELEKADP